MQEELLRQMASQAGLSPEHVEAIATGQTQRLVEMMSRDNPTMGALLSSMMAARGDGAEARPRARRGRRLVERLRELEEELDAAEELVSFLAGVLGACPCFGLDRRCPDCGGQGAPGAYDSSDVTQLLAWTRPSLERLGLSIVRGKPKVASDTTAARETANQEEEKDA